MNGEEKEKMLDLLCDKFVYGLTDEQTRQLESLGYNQKEADSIEMTVAALGLVDVDAQSAMPSHFQAKLLREADGYFGFDQAEAEEPAIPERQIVLSSGRSPWFGWLGWAAAAMASIALAVSLFVPRGDGIQAGGQKTPTPTPEERLSPEQQRQRLIDSSSPGQVIMAQWGKGKMDDLTVSGDVVWNAAKQVGYLRLKGLPKNDVGTETYQLWIVDGSQNPKTPIDGGTFDIKSDGEVIIPVNAKLKAIDPKAFAITVEKPGGVVVSEQGKLAALAPVKPAKA